MRSMFALLALVASPSFADFEGEEGLYVMSAECVDAAGSKTCMANSAVCLSAKGKAPAAWLVRRSSALQEHGVPAKTEAFRLEDASATFSIFYPVAGSKCTPVRRVPAKAKVSVDESGTRIELTYDYQPLDLETCQLGGSKEVRTTTYFKASSGDEACGKTKKSDLLRLPACKEGHGALWLEKIHTARGTLRALAVLDDKKEQRWVIKAPHPEATTEELINAACTAAGAQAPVMEGPVLDALTHKLKSFLCASDECRPRMNQAAPTGKRG